MTKRYEGKTVLITGGAGGLGRAAALGFGAEGAHLVLCDVNQTGLDESAQLLKAQGTTSSVHKVDLSVEAEIHAFAADVIALHPTIDLLYNNAGLAYGKISRGFEDLTQAEWLFFFSVNTVAPLLLAQALRAPLTAAKGVILNQSSMASYVPGTAYGITKSALNAMNFAMAANFAKDGIRVNAIAPGIMETLAGKDGVAPENYQRIQDMQMLKAHGLPEDIVNLALFLGSSDARFITNIVANCDAGHPFRGFRA